MNALSQKACLEIAVITILPVISSPKTVHKKCYFMNPSIIYTIYPFRVMEGLEPIPSDNRWDAGFTMGRSYRMDQHAENNQTTVGVSVTCLSSPINHVDFSLIWYGQRPDRGSLQRLQSVSLRHLHAHVHFLGRKYSTEFSACLKGAYESWLQLCSVFLFKPSLPVFGPICHLFTTRLFYCIF